MNTQHKDTLRVMECFSGIGATTQALKNLNINHSVVAISEIDKYAIKAYKLLHGEVDNYGDISNIDPYTLPDIDLLSYTSPCQDISISGRGKGLSSNTRSSLLWEVEKIIKVKRPTYLLFENVKAIISKKYIEDFNKWLDILNNLGYTTYYTVLNAKDYNVPQNRERLFAISILNNKHPFSFPETVQPTVHLNDLLLKEVDNKYIVSDKGLNGFLVDNKFKRKDRFFSNIYKPNRTYANTLTTSNYKLFSNYVILNDNPLKIRKLTPLEFFRLMGFSDTHFNIVRPHLSDTQLFKLMGNSIVVDVLEHIFINLFR